MVVQRVDALGYSEEQFPVMCHALPPSAQLDGLLGLDFLRRNRLVIDFQAGEISLE